MLCILLSPQLGYSLGVEPAASGLPLGDREAIQSWAPISQSPKLRMSQDHRVRHRHSLQLRGSCSKSLYLPRAARRDRPPRPLECSRPSPQILSTPLPCPKLGQPRGPGWGGWLAKFLQTVAPRARREPESIFMQLYVQVKARSSACAHAHTRIYTHHTLPCIHLHT